MEATIKAPTVAKARRPFGWKDIVGYFFGDFGCNMSFSLISGYMFLFFTQYIGIKLEHYALIILLTKIWDGINDPIIGALVDRFTPKKGDKFRPWIFWGAWPLAIAAAVMFLDASAWPYWGKLALMIVGYMVWDIAYTVVNVPYGSLNSVITADPVQRSQLSTFRSFGAIVAGIPLGIVIPLFAYKQQMVDGVEKSIFQGQNMFPIALVLGAVALISFMILWASTVERIQHGEHDGEKFNYFKTLKSFFTSRPILGLVIATLAQTIFMMSISSLGAMTFQMYFGNGKLNSLSVLTYLVPMIAGAFLVKPLVKRFGKKNIVGWPLLGTIFVYVLMLVLPITNPYLWIGLQILASLFAIGTMLVGWAMVADAIDYSEYKTSRREEGSIYATYSMMRKIGQGVGQALVPAIIALVLPGLVMSNAATWNMEYATSIKNLSILFPLAGSVIMFVAYQFIYNLDTKTLAEVEEALGRNGKEVDTSLEAITRKEE
jgi:GPH family glycoside/pentoside/hexuronide:cation symporter